MRAIEGIEVTDEAMRFAEYYCYEPTYLRTQDLAILTTANELDDRPANYQRFAAICDRRFTEWKATECR